MTDSTLTRPGQDRPLSKNYKPLPHPGMLLDQMPLGAYAAEVEEARGNVRRVLSGTDDRLIVVAGPCSVHDPDAALDYARWLAIQAAEFRDDLMIVMRAYLEKPRTTTGWKGLISDPDLDGSGNVARGLQVARQLLIKIAAEGVPAATEWVDPMMTRYVSDTITWGAIGARTTQSQVHRALASGLPMPIGFKNAPDGDVQAAVDGCRSAAERHVITVMSPQDGTPAVTRTAGNPDCHVVLRGGRWGPNYQRAHVGGALALLSEAGLPRRVMVDVSHGNSGKDHNRQPLVARAVAGQVASGNASVIGVMIESFLRAGRQELSGGRGGKTGRAGLLYGQSVTDACIDTETTRQVMVFLAEAVRQRRSSAPN